MQAFIASGMTKDQLIQQVYLHMSVPSKLFQRCGSISCLSATALCLGEEHNSRKDFNDKLLSGC